MTEQVPTGQSVLERERARLASERAKLEHKESVLEREELFGKYDEGVTPAEGEMTYQQYLELRPSEGVVRDGDGFRDAQSGKFVEAKQYESQKTATAVNDKTIEAAIASNRGKQYESPYETMGILQLAKEAAKARLAGNRTLDEDLREFAERHITNSTIRSTDDNEGAEQAQARYDADMARYNSLVERFIALSRVAPAEKVPDTFYKGEKVTIENVFTSPDGKKAVQIVDSNGKAHLVFEEEVTTASAKDTPQLIDKMPEVQPANDAKASEALRPVGEVSVVEGKPENQAKGAEPVVRAQDSAKGEEAEKASRLDRIKNWFKKEGNNYREFRGTAYWSEKWDRIFRGTRDAVLDFGVEDSMSDEEKETKRKRNRVIVLVGVGGLAGVAVGSIGGALIHGLVSPHDVHAAGGGDIPRSPTLKGLGVPHQHDVLHLPLDASATVPGAELSASVPEVPTISAEAYNVPAGWGGEQLLTRLGIEPSKWYRIEDSLLSLSPSDFYRMPDGHVGIAHTGILQQEAQELIETLR